MSIVMQCLTRCGLHDLCCVTTNTFAKILVDPLGARKYISIQDGEKLPEPYVADSGEERVKRSTVLAFSACSIIAVGSCVQHSFCSTIKTLLIKSLFACVYTK